MKLASMPINASLVDDIITQLLLLAGGPTIVEGAVSSRHNNLRLLDYGCADMGLMYFVRRDLQYMCQCELSTATDNDMLVLYPKFMRYDIIVCTTQQHAPYPNLHLLQPLLARGGVMVFRGLRSHLPDKTAHFNAAQLKLIWWHRGA